MLAISLTSPTVLFYAILALATLTAAGLVMALLQAYRGSTPEAVKERLDRIGSPERLPTRKTNERLEKTLRVLSRVTSPTEQQEVTTLRKNLSYAGYRTPNAPMYFFGSKTLGALILGGAAMVYSFAHGQDLLHSFVTIVAATALGLYGPNLWVRMKTARRNDAMNKALPNALDLLIVCVEAGLGLDMALKRVGEEIGATAPELAKELNFVSLELSTGIARQRALANLAERNSLDDLRSLSTILVQADKFGTSVGRALRVSADSIRTKRRQAAEEKAAKTTVKLTFPLVLFILPATFIIVIGPGIIKLVQNVLPQFVR